MTDKRVAAVLSSLRDNLRELEVLLLNDRPRPLTATEIDADVMEAIRHIGGKLSLTTIREEMGEKYSVPQMRRSLGRLRTEKLIQQEGRTKDAVYCVVESS